MEREINKILSDVYIDLEKLQKAREQVEIVTESSNRLTQSTSKLLIDLQNFSKDLTGESLNKFSKLTESIDKYEKLTTSSIENAKQNIEELKTISINIIKDQEMKSARLLKRFEESLAQLKGNAEQNIEEIKEISVDTIKMQDRKLSELISLVNNCQISENFKKLHGQFELQDLKNTKVLFLCKIIGLISVGCLGFAVYSLYRSLF